MAKQSVFERIPGVAAFRALFRALDDAADSFFESLAEANFGESEKRLQPIRTETRLDKAKYRRHQK